MVSGAYANSLMPLLLLLSVLCAVVQSVEGLSTSDLPPRLRRRVEARALGEALAKRSADAQPVVLPIHQLAARIPQNEPGDEEESGTPEPTPSEGAGSDPNTLTVEDNDGPITNSTTVVDDPRSGLTPAALSADSQSYYALIQTGDINFRVALDTASSDLWIVSSECKDGSCDGVPKYPVAYDSPTFVEVDGNQTKFEASYADSTVASGFVARETVHLANLTVVNQTFALVSECNVTFNDQMSGILGMGFPRLSSISSLVANSTPFFVELAQQGMLDYPLFGVSLTRNSSGTLALGAIDSSVVQNVSMIEWNPVVQFPPFGLERNVSGYLHWAIPLESFAAGNSSFTPTPSYPEITNELSYALIDIGASGIYGPYQDVAQLYATIDGARLVDDTTGQWVTPCDTETVLSFQFGGFNFTLLPSDYLIGPAEGNPNLCLSWPRGQPRGSDGVDWQFGTPFLRTVYSIFSYGINDQEPPIIGFYPLYNSTSLPTPDPEALASFFASESATIPTTLPNFVLSTPTSVTTTLPYAFNSSIPATIGGIVTSELATSTYSPILRQPDAFNVSAIPLIQPPPTVITMTLTDPEGSVTTTTSTSSIPVVTLGVPPNWTVNAASARGVTWRTWLWTVVLSLTVPFVFV